MDSRETVFVEVMIGISTDDLSECRDGSPLPNYSCFILSENNLNTYAITIRINPNVTPIEHA